MILQVNNVTKQFGGLTAVNDVSFDLPEGQILGLIGPNGAGKTTLFNCINGVYPATKGTVIFKGQTITGLPTYKGADLGEATVIADQIMEFVGLAPRAGMLAASLNVAQKKRLELARALAAQPYLLLLDEVLAGLNTAEVTKMLDIIRQIRNQGVTIIMIEHIMHAVMNVSDRIIVLNYGALIAEGTPEEVSQNQEVIEAYLGDPDLAERLLEEERA